jgi:WD40 repeat protein
MHPLQREQTSGFFSAAFSPDSRSIITTGSGQVWDTKTGKLREWLPEPRDFLSASWNPDGKLIVTSDSRGSIRVWNGRSDAQRMETNGSTLSAVFSPKGDRVVTSAGDRAVIWDVATGNPVGRSMVHSASVYSGAFSPDGRLVVTASRDGNAQVWNADSSLPVGLPMTHPAGVLWAGFSPDGRRVATVAADGVARLWTVLLGDGSKDDTKLLVELAGALSGVSMEPARRAEKLSELRAQVAQWKAGQVSAASSLRGFFGLK